MFKYFEAIEELPKELKTPIVKVLELFREDIAETVKKSDFERFERATEENFNRVWRTIGELAEAQRELVKSQKELAEAQRASESRLTRLEQVVEELVEAQKRTEEDVRRLAIEVNELRIGQENLRIGQENLRIGQENLSIGQENLRIGQENLRIGQENLRIGQENLRIGQENLRKEVGGLARSSGYAFENEAYRMLPKTLKGRYGIELKERLIRKVIDDSEINILGIGIRDGKEVVVVGEAKVRLEDMGVFDELEEKVKVVEERYSGKKVVRVLVTHIASGKMLREAEERGVLVIQSFEWEV